VAELEVKLDQLGAECQAYTARIADIEQKHAFDVKHYQQVCQHQRYLKFLADSSCYMRTQTTVVLEERIAASSSAAAVDAAVQAQLEKSQR